MLTRGRAATRLSRPSPRSAENRGHHATSTIALAAAMPGHNTGRAMRSCSIMHWVLRAVQAAHTRQHPRSTRADQRRLTSLVSRTLGAEAHVDLIADAALGDIRRHAEVAALERKAC